MKKAILVATCVAALSTFTTLGAFAQTTGPASQDTMKQNDDMTKGGAGMSGDKMSKKKMSKSKSMKDKSKMSGPSSSDEMKK